MNASTAFRSIDKPVSGIRASLRTGQVLDGIHGCRKGNLRKGMTN